MEDARRRVLVADAEPDVRLLCRSTLEFAGYDVVEAGDGEEALRMTREYRPDAVLLDVMLAGPDGWRVLAALQAGPDVRAIPVVLLSGQDAESDPVRAWSQGAADWLAKPFSPLTLSQVLQDVLASAPEERERRRMLLETPELLQNE